MEKQKNCPYCGELIMASAKKCRYCCMWLAPRDAVMPVGEAPTDEQTTIEQPEGSIGEAPTLPQAAYPAAMQDEEPEDEELEEDDEMSDAEFEAYIKEHPFETCVPFSDNTINILFWVAVIGSACTAIHSLIDGQGEMDFGSNKVGIIAQFLSWMPSWLGSIINTVGACALLYALREGMKSVTSSLNIWLGACIAFEVVGTVLDLIVGDDAVSLASFCLALLGAIAYFIAGLKLTLIKGFAFVGWTFVATPILTLGGLILVGIIGLDTELGCILQAALYFIVPCIPYFAIREKCIG